MKTRGKGAGCFAAWEKKEKKNLCEISRRGGGKQGGHVDHSSGGLQKGKEGIMTKKGGSPMRP